MSDEQKGLDWAEVRQHAETRPAMYLGDPATAHRLAILQCLRLVWQAKVFRQPKAVKIDLSPTQYIVRVECGPLIRPIQQNFRFGMGQTLGGAWHSDSRTYSEKLAKEENERGGYHTKGSDGKAAGAIAFAGRSGLVLMSPFSRISSLISWCGAFARTKVYGVKAGPTLCLSAHPSCQKNHRLPVCWRQPTWKRNGLPACPLRRKTHSGLRDCLTSTIGATQNTSHTVTGLPATLLPTGIRKMTLLPTGY